MTSITFLNDHRICNKYSTTYQYALTSSHTFTNNFRQYISLTLDHYYSLLPLILTQVLTKD